MRVFKNNFSRYLLYLALSIFTFGFTGCSDDDDLDDVIDGSATGSLTVQDQTISQNTLILESVTVGQDSWVVVRNSGSETSPDIVSEPVFLEEGTHQNVEIPLTSSANLTGDDDGDDLVVMIHTDTGTAGTFDYNSQTGTDMPVTTTTGTHVTETINVTGPGLFAEDDQVITDNQVVFSSVRTGSPGWVVLYGQNEDGSINENEIIGRQYVGAGEFSDFAVPFDEDYTYVPGSTVYPRLFLDDPADEDFTFTVGGTEDLPVRYGFDATTGEGMFVGNTSTTGGFTIQ